MERFTASFNKSGVSSEQSLSKIFEQSFFPPQMERELAQFSSHSHRQMTQVKSPVIGVQNASRFDENA